MNSQNHTAIHECSEAGADSFETELGRSDSRGDATIAISPAFHRIF